MPSLRSASWLLARRRFAFVLLLGLTTALPPSLATLQLQAFLNDEPWTDGFRLHEGQLVNARTHAALPDNLTWRITGDLRTNDALLNLTPKQFQFGGQALAAGGPIQLYPRRAHRVIFVRRDEVWHADDYVDALLVHVWWQDGELRHVVPVPTRTAQGRKGEIVGGRAWEVTADRQRGHAFVLLWKDGAFLPPPPHLDSAAARDVLASLYLDDDVRLAATIRRYTNAELETGRTHPTLLHFALEAGRAVAVPLLVERDLAPDRRYRTGATALMWGGNLNRAEAISTLLTAGAKPGVKSDGERAFDLALRKSNLAAAVVLLDPTIRRDVNDLLERAILAGDADSIAAALARLDPRQRQRVDPDLPAMIDAVERAREGDLKPKVVPSIFWPSASPRIDWLTTGQAPIPPADGMLSLPRPVRGTSFIGREPLLVGPERIERDLEGRTIVGVGSSAGVTWLPEELRDTPSQWAAVEVVIGPDGTVLDLRLLGASSGDMGGYARDALGAARFAAPTLAGRPVVVRTPLFVLLTRDVEK